MSIKTKANFITAINSAAAALTSAWTDTVLTEVAEVLRHPSHPLRRTEKLFNFDAKTGVVTTDTAYIDAVYDRGFAPSKGNPFSKITEVVFGLVSATVETAAPSDIVLTFDKNVTAADVFNILPAKSISGIAINGNVVTVTVTVPFAVGNVISFSGEFQNGLNNLELLSQAVTNNIA